MSALAAVAPTLKLLLPLLGSPVDDEALGAAREIERTLKDAGLTLHDLALEIAKPPPVDVRHEPVSRPKPPNWREVVGWCLAHDEDNGGTILSRNDVNFLKSLQRWRGPLTLRQLDWLHDIQDRIWAEVRGK